MGNKILLDIMLPATQERYEFRVPLDLTVKEGAKLIASIIASRDPIRYGASDGPGLMHLEERKEGAELHPLETFRTIMEHGEITDGVRLALI